MKIVKDISDLTTSPEGFDYRAPIVCEFNKGMPEGASRLVALTLEPGKGALVVSFEATGWARIVVESTKDGKEWTEVDRGDPTNGNHEYLTAGNRIMRRYAVPAETAAMRCKVQALRALNRVDIFSQAS